MARLPADHPYEPFDAVTMAGSVSDRFDAMMAAGAMDEVRALAAVCIGLRRITGRARFGPLFG